MRTAPNKQNPSQLYNTKEIKKKETIQFKGQVSVIVLNERGKTQKERETKIQKHNFYFKKAGDWRAPNHSPCTIIYLLKIKLRTRTRLKRVGFFFCLNSKENYMYRCMLKLMLHTQKPNMVHDRS